MPLMECQLNGLPGWKWGESGKCYTYNRGNIQSEAEAKRAAREQGKAIEASKSEQAETQAKLIDDVE